MTSAQNNNTQTSPDSRVPGDVITGLLVSLVFLMVIAVTVISFISLSNNDKQAMATFSSANLTELQVEEIKPNNLLSATERTEAIQLATEEAEKQGIDISNPRVWEGENAYYVGVLDSAHHPGSYVLECIITDEMTCSPS